MPHNSTFDVSSAAIPIRMDVPSSNNSAIYHQYYLVLNLRFNLICSAHQARRGSTVQKDFLYSAGVSDKLV